MGGSIRARSDLSLSVGEFWILAGISDLLTQDRHPPENFSGRNAFKTLTANSKWREETWEGAFYLCDISQCGRESTQADASRDYGNAVRK
jgi:hypothetical protein